MWVRRAMAEAQSETSKICEPLVDSIFTTALCLEFVSLYICRIVNHRKFSIPGSMHSSPLSALVLLRLTDTRVKRVREGKGRVSRSSCSRSAFLSLSVRLKRGYKVTSFMKEKAWASTPKKFKYISSFEACMVHEQPALCLAINKFLSSNSWNVDLAFHAFWSLTYEWQALPLSGET